jgi:hypothetical protein
MWPLIERAKDLTHEEERPVNTADFALSETAVADLAGGVFRG